MDFDKDKQYFLFYNINKELWYLVIYIFFAASTSVIKGVYKI